MASRSELTFCRDTQKEQLEEATLLEDFYQDIDAKYLYDTRYATPKHSLFITPELLDKIDQAKLKYRPPVEVSAVMRECVAAGQSFDWRTLCDPTTLKGSELKVIEVQEDRKVQELAPIVDCWKRAATELCRRNNSELHEDIFDQFWSARVVAHRLHQKLSTLEDRTNNRYFICVEPTHGIQGVQLATVVGDKLLLDLAMKNPSNFREEECRQTASREGIPQFGGIVPAFFEDAERVCVREGCNAIVLFPMDDSLISYYKKFGFRQWPGHEGYLIKDVSQFGGDLRSIYAARRHSSPAEAAVSSAALHAPSESSRVQESVETHEAGGGYVFGVPLGAATIGSAEDHVFTALEEQKEESAPQVDFDHNNG